MVGLQQFVSWIILISLIHLSRVLNLENLIEYATHLVVDQVLINLPSEQYKIWDYASPLSSWGIPVSINLNAP